MAITKRADSKHWRIEIYVPGKKKRVRVSSGTADEGEARTMEMLLKSAANSNMTREKFIAAADAIMGWDQQTGIPVAQLWTTYTETNPTAGPHTIRQRKSISESFTTWMKEAQAGTEFLHEITPRQALLFSNWLQREKGGKGKTHNNRIGNIRTVFHAINLTANMEKNPFEIIPKADEDDSLHGRAFNTAEQEKLFKAAKTAGNDWVAICTLAKYSGARLKDIAHLKWNQIENNRINITPSKTKKHGIRALIPIHPSVAAELNKLEQAGSYVFPALAKRYTDNDRSDSGFIQEVMDTANINKEGAHITFHCWRHTFRTAMSEAKVPQEVAMRIAGWTNQSTAEIYNHDFTEIETAINALK